MKNDGKLPVLDVLVIRINDHLEFDVYRKATTTSRYICINSQHSPQHKLSAFQSMIHRLLTFPLTKDRYNTELSHIRDVAAIDGFNSSVITNMVIKKRKAFKREQMATLFAQNRELEKQDKKSFILTYHPALNEKIKKVVKNLGYNFINKPHRKLGALLGSTKDKIEKGD